jgi:toxin secretion/phage lysis holin
MKAAAFWNYVNGGFAAVGGFLGWYLGGFDGLLYALITLAIADYVTGVICAFIKKELSSEVGAKGIAKKVFIFTLIGLGHLIDMNLLANGSALRTALIFWYLGNEGISLVENAVVLGVPVPDVLKNALAQIRNRGNKSVEKDTENNDGSDA